MKQNSLYRHSKAYAVEQDEIALWRESHQQKMDCGGYITEQFTEQFDGHHVPKDVIPNAIHLYGSDCVAEVLVSTILAHKGDGRINTGNSEWAEQYPLSDPENSREVAMHSIHPGVINIFANQYQKDMNQQIEGNVLRIEAEYDDTPEYHPEETIPLPPEPDAPPEQHDEPRADAKTLMDRISYFRGKMKDTHGIQLNCSKIGGDSKSVWLNPYNLLDNQENEELSRAAASLGLASVGKIKVKSIECTALEFKRSLIPPRKLDAQMAKDIALLSGVVIALKEDGQTEAFKELMTQKKPKTVHDLLSLYDTFEQQLQNTAPQMDEPQPVVEVEAQEQEQEYEEETEEEISQTLGMSQ